MTYSCSDFTDDILAALKITVPDGAEDSPSMQADLALAEIERLQARVAELTALEVAPASRLDRARLAVRLIRTARNHLREAGADNAADYAARALKSAEGGERHARGLETRASLPPPTAV